MNYFQKIENKEWQSFLNKVLFKTFFHSLEWEEFLEKEFSWLRFERYLYKNEAILSLARVKVFSKEKLISHPFCEYGGPLPLQDKIDGENFKNNLLSEFKDRIRIRFHPHTLNYFSIESDKGEKSNINTYFIESFQQKTKDQVWNSFRKTLCHSIKKSQNQEVKIKRCDNEKELSSFYNLYIKSAKRHLVPAYPFSFFKYFLDSSNSEIVLAIKDGKIIAGSVFLFYERFIHYFLNASDERFKDLYSNHLILWDEIQKYAGGNNYEVFDLGGTRSGSPLEVFKSGWGTKKYPIYEVSNLSKESGIRESKLRKVFGLLPDFLIKRLSPYLLKLKV